MEKRHTSLQQMSINPIYYRKTAAETWTGRDDGSDPAAQRWHQRIIVRDLLKEDLPALESGQKGISLIGFACDEGVGRNGGRTGAKEGPLSFRKTCGSLPVHFEATTVFTDAGDIICENRNMDEAQIELGKLIHAVLEKGYQPLVIGGGHEVTYGHYLGIKAFLKANTAINNKTNTLSGSTTGTVRTQQLGIINFDAHFDMREANQNGYNSGTGFAQIAADCAKENCVFRYLPVGIQQNSNTLQLFNKAKDLKVNYIDAAQFMPAMQLSLLQQIDQFIAAADVIYLTICMDVFSSAVAPGVSAAAYSGLFPDPFFFSILQHVLRSGKVISSDIAELSPAFDQELRTAKLAGALAFKMISP